MMKLSNAIESTCSAKPKIFAIWPFTEKFGASWSHVLQMKKMRLRETNWLAYCCMGIRGTSTRSPYPPPIYPQLFFAPFKLPLQATHFRPRVIPGRVWMPHKGAWGASTVKLRARVKMHCWASQLNRNNVCFGPGGQELILMINMMQVIVMRIRTMVALIKSSYVLVTVTPSTDILHWVHEITDFQLFFF